MKKTLLLMMAMLGLAGTAKADVEWTIWEGSVSMGNWTGYQTVSPVDYSDITAGDVLCIYATAEVGETQYYLQKITSDWKWGDFDCKSQISFTTTGTDANAEFVMTSDFVTELTTSGINGLVVKGCHYTLTKLAIKKKNSMIRSVLSDEDKALGNWAQSYSVTSGYSNAVEGDFLYLAASRQATPVNDRYYLSKSAVYASNATLTGETITFNADEGKYGWEINGNWLNKYSHGATVTVEFGEALAAGLSLVVEYKYLDGESVEQTTTESSSVSASATTATVTIPTKSTHVTNIYLQGSNSQTVKLHNAYVDYENDSPYCQTQVSYGSSWTYLFGVNSFTHDNWKKLTSSEASTIAGAESVHLGGAFYDVTGFYLYHPITSFSIGSIGMATFCANVAVSVPDGIEAYYATISGSNVVLNKITDGIIPANTGVIIKGDAGSVVEFTATTTATTYASNVLTGVTSATAMTAGDYILYNNGGIAEFRRVTATTLAANKAYLPAAKLSGTAPSLSVIFDDTVTGIQLLDNQEANPANNSVYNLAGQRVNQPTKGLYIINGKKVVLK